MGIRDKPVVSKGKLLALLGSVVVLFLLFNSGGKGKGTVSGSGSTIQAVASELGGPGLRSAGSATAQDDVFYINFETTKGSFVMSVHRSWAPLGAARMELLVKEDFFNGLPVAFFRNIKKFMVQFGIHGSPRMAIKWSNKVIKDDPNVGQSNTVGMVSFATSGPNTRTTQMFINYGDNSFLNKQGFTPFGRIEGDGMDVIRSLHVTGEGAPGGPGPNQGVIQRRGNSYLEKDFPEIDYIKRATFVRFNEV